MAALNRYSTLVAWAKLALPLIAIGLLSTLFLFSRSPDPDAALPFADIDIDRVAREQRLSQPRFAGTLLDGREIVLVSESAAPIAGAPNMIRLVGVQADVEIDATRDANLRAGEGDIDMAAQAATLRGGVQLQTTDGYRLEGDDMVISLADMRMQSPGPVSIVGPGVTLQAGAMVLSGPESAAMLHFTDGVRLIYRPGEGDEEP